MLNVQEAKEKYKKNIEAQSSELIKRGCQLVKEYCIDTMIEKAIDRCPPDEFILVEIDTNDCHAITEYLISLGYRCELRRKGLRYTYSVSGWGSYE